MTSALSSLWTSAFAASVFRLTFSWAYAFSSLLLLLHLRSVVLAPGWHLEDLSLTRRKHRYSHARKVWALFLASAKSAPMWTHLSSAIFDDNVFWVLSPDSALLDSDFKLVGESSAEYSGVWVVHVDYIDVIISMRTLSPSAKDTGVTFFPIASIFFPPKSCKGLPAGSTVRLSRPIDSKGFMNKMSAELPVSIKTLCSVPVTFAAATNDRCEDNRELGNHIH